jgi:hypothetical protein
MTTARRPSSDGTPAGDDVTSQLILALTEIEATTAENELTSRQRRAMRRLETSTFDDLLGHQHRVRLRLYSHELLGTIDGFGPGTLRLTTDDRSPYLIATEHIDTVEFLAARLTPALELVSFATELAQLTSQGACWMVDTNGQTHQLDHIIALAEDYLYYRSHRNVSCAVRLSRIALVSPGLQISS